MNKIHYCPIGLVQRQFGIYITGAGMETTKPGEPYPHAYHSSDYYFTWRKGRALAEWEYQILYIRSGEGESIRVCPHVGGRGSDPCDTVDVIRSMSACGQRGIRGDGNSR